MNEAISVIQRRSFLTTLQAVDRHYHLKRAISLLLVVGLHLGVFWWLLQQVAPVPVAKPMIMEVTMLTPPKPVPVLKEPPPPPPKAIEKPKPIVKPVVKPVVQKPIPPKPLAPKVLTQPQTPVVTKEDFTVPAEPKTEPVKTPPPVVPSSPAPSAPAQPSKNSQSSEGNGPSDSKTVVSGVVPLVRVPPKYPARAMSRHIEGWVKIEFTITTSGTVENPKVVAAEPPDIFDDAALSAISEWEFKEKMVNGKAVEQRAVQTLQFKLAN